MSGRSISGTWLSPLPVLLLSSEEEEDEVFTNEVGDIKVTVDKHSRIVTLFAGDETETGKINAEYSRIRWGNGAVWVYKELDDRTFQEEQPNLLSDHQVDVVVDLVSESVNVWVLPESFQRAVLQVPVQKANEVLKECLCSFMAEHWVQAATSLLNETKPTAEKAADLQEILKANIREPLVVALNDRIDIPFMCEGLEERILCLIVDKLLDQIVELTVVGMERTGFA